MIQYYMTYEVGKALLHKQRVNVCYTVICLQQTGRRASVTAGTANVTVSKV
jgi:hypothetical protein